MLALTKKKWDTVHGIFILFHEGEGRSWFRLRTNHIDADSGAGTAVDSLHLLSQSHRWEVSDMERVLVLQLFLLKKKLKKVPYLQQSPLCVSGGEIKTLSTADQESLQASWWDRHSVLPLRGRDILSLIDNGLKYEAFRGGCFFDRDVRY